MVANLAPPLLPEYLPAELQAGAPIEVPDAETTIWLFTLEHWGPPHLARRDIRAVSELLLRRLLSTIAGEWAAPNEWTFERTHWGKPRISGPLPYCLNFSVSYGDDSLAVAISKSHEVGVDLETTRPATTTEIPWRELCETEQAELRTLPVKKRYERFVCMWTLKEAFTKCLGLGCSLEFDQLETWLWPPQVKSRPTDQARRQVFAFHHQRLYVAGRPHVLALAAARPVR
jgi:phosphopantetheinyl transferase